MLLLWLQRQLQSLDEQASSKGLVSAMQALRMLVGGVSDEFDGECVVGGLSYFSAAQPELWASAVVAAQRMRSIESCILEMLGAMNGWTSRTSVMAQSWRSACGNQDEEQVMRLKKTVMDAR